MTRPMSIIGTVGVVVAFTAFSSLPALAQTSPPVIEHTPIAGPVPANQPVPVAATVTDADPADSVLTVQVNFLRGMDPPKLFPLTPQGGGLYEGSIPGAEVLSPGFSYRIEARDPSDSLSIFPPLAQPDIWVEVAGGTGSPPVIAHTPPAGPLPANAAVQLTAVVTDPDGNETIDRVYVQLYVEGPPMEFDMAATGQPNEFGAQIPAGMVQPPGIEYRIIAEDADGNATGHPVFSEGPGHWVAVSTGGGSGSPPVIAHTLVTGPVPAGQPVAITAVVTDPDGNETIDEVQIEVTHGGAPLHFPLTAGGEPNQFVGQVPASEVVNPGFSYRVIARDTQGLDSAIPVFQYGPQWVDVTAGGGTGSAPQITHTPLSSPQPPASAITVTATVTDVDGDLDAVGFEIYKEGVPPTYYAMTPASGNTYEGTIPASAVASPGFGYRVIAEDLANNVKGQPGFAYDPYWITVSSGSGSPPVVTHTPIAGPLPKNQPVVVTAVITDADGNDTVTDVHIEMSRGGAPMVFGMSPTGTANQWSGTLPAGEVLDPGFSYRIVAEDGTGNVTAKPAFQYDPYWVEVNAGTGGGSPPDITHTPIASPKPPGASIQVTATVTDPDGDLKQVGIEFERSGAPPSYFPMALTTKGVYQGTIPAGEVVAPGFEYRIVAEDSLMNVRAKPAYNYDPYWIAVGSGGGTGSPPSITHTPLAGPVPAGQPVEIRARVTDPDNDPIDAVEVEFSSGGAPRVYAMGPDADPGWYLVSIPGGDVFPPGFEYRVVAEDTTGNMAANPGYQNPPYWVDVTSGTGGGSAPIITHTPLTSPKPQMLAIEVTAAVTDVDGDLTNVGIEFQRPGGAPSYFPMAPQDGGVYGGTIPAGEVVPPGFNYRIVAEDANSNARGNPGFNYDPYWIDVSSGGATEGNPPNITHTPVPSPQPQGQPITVTATVTDPDSNDTITEVHIELSHGGAPLFFPMTPTAGTNTYTGQIPGAEVTPPGFDYRVVANDAQGHVRGNPRFQYDPYWVEVSYGGGGGGVKPVIAFTPLPSPQAPYTQIQVTATVTDADGDLMEVGIETYRPDAPPNYYLLNPIGNNQYQGYIMAGDVVSPGFGYRIIAEDLAHNMAANPEFQYDPYWVDVGTGGATEGNPPVITHTPIPSPQPQGVAIPVTATVSDPDAGDTITTVEIELSRGGPPMHFPMTLGTKGVYSGQIPPGEVVAPGFEYRVVAHDAQGHVRGNPVFSVDPYWVQVSGGSGGGSRPEITFTPLASPKPPGVDIGVSATVVDPDGDLNNAGIEITRPGMAPTWYMLNPAGGNVYTGTVFGGDVQPPGFSYRILAKDMNYNEAASPEWNYDPYWVDVSTGGTIEGNPPTITHTQVSSPQGQGVPIHVTARVSDPDTADTITDVHIELSRGGAPMFFPMSLDPATGDYAGDIPGPEVTPPGFDYRVVASDAQGHVKGKPAFAYSPYWVEVSWGGGGGSRPSITFTPLASPKPPWQDIVVQATVADPDGDLMEVGVDMSRPGMPPIWYALNPIGNNVYEGRIFGGDVQSPGFSYRVVARDQNWNETAKPEWNYDPYWVDVGTGTPTEGNPPTITHTPIPSPQSQGTNITVTAAVTDPDSNDTITDVHIELSHGGPPLHFPMMYDASTGKYTGQIPGPEVMPPGFDYRVVANDAQGHTKGNPAFANPPYWVDVSVGAGGGARPEIIFTPLASPRPPWQEIVVQATVTDVDGNLMEVGVDMSRPGMPPMWYGLNPIGNDLYEGRIFGGDIQSPGFSYRVIARDTNWNETAKPEWNYDPYWVDVSAGGTGGGNPPTITHTPLPSPKPMGQVIRVTARVTDPDSTDTITDVHVEMTRGGAPMFFPMWLDPATGDYVGDIPGPEVMAPGFDYRVVASDAQGHVKAKPEFQNPAYWVQVGGGTGGGSRPEITFTPLASPKPPWQDVDVTATVTDPDNNLMEVGIEINRSGMPPMWYPLNPMGNNVYQGHIFGGDVQSPGFNYRIIARDTSFNETAKPAFNYDPYWVEVRTGGEIEGNPPQITHVPVPSPKPMGQVIRVTARVTDPDSADSITDVHIELSHGGPPMFFPMWLDPATGDYAGDIPGPEVMAPGFDYRVVANDAQGHVKGNPQFQNPPYWVEVGWNGGGGGSRPEITFSPLASPKPPWQDIVVTAGVTDPDGDLREVGIEINRPGMPPMYYMMNPSGDNEYQGRIFGGDVQSPGFNYRIVAKDMNFNDAAKPAFNYDPYWVDVSAGGGGGGNPPQITHTPIPSPEPMGQGIHVTARVTDPDSGGAVADVHLELSHGGPPLHFPMFPNPATGEYAGDIPGNEVTTPGFEYRVVAGDDQGLVRANPRFQDPPYWVEVGWSGGGGGSRPEITVTPLASPKPPWQDIVVRATVTDPDGDLRDVGIEINRPGMPPMFFPLEPMGAGSFEGRISGGDVQPPGFNYRITAKDMNFNDAAKPEWNFDPYWVDVSSGGGSGGNPPEITHSPLPSPKPMGQNIRVTARVTDPDSGDVVTEVHLEVTRMGTPMQFPMSLDPATGDYAGDVPGHEVMPPGFDYRVVAGDAQGHVRANPRFQNPPYWIDVGYGGSGGGARPEVTFTPLTSPKPPWQDVTVSATATDPDGDLMEVGIEIQRPGMPPMFFPLNPTGTGTYQGRVMSGDVQPPGFNYRIIARDMNFNETAEPSFNYDPYWVDVSGGGTTQGNPPQITHTPVPSPKPMGQNILVTATVTDPDSNDTVTDVHLEVLRGGPPMHFPMSRDPATGIYSGQIPAPEVATPGFEYRVVAADAQGNVKAMPVFSQPAYWVDVSWGGGGGSKPEITHTRLASPQSARRDIEVTATVTDPDTDLTTVGIEVNRPNMPPTFYPMDPLGGGLYRGLIFGGDVQRPGFSYRIVAEDRMHNRRGCPLFNYDPFWVDVGAGQGLPPTIVHSPIPSPVVPNQSIRVTANVTDPDTSDAVSEVWVELRHGGPPMRFPLSPDTAAGAFAGQIPGSEVWEPGFEYRVFAEDGNGNVVSKPSFEYPAYWVDAFQAGAEGLRPVITHTPLGGPLPPHQEVRVTAAVSDDDGDLREVRLEVSRPGMPPTSLPMMDEGGGTYGATIWPMAVEFPGFGYRIMAEDQANHMASNPGPSYPEYWVGVSQGTGGGGGEPPIITHRVLPSPQEPNRPIEVTCTVTDRDSLDEIWGVALEIDRPNSPPLELPMNPIVRTDSTGAQATYYLARIDAMEVQRPGFGYRIKAMDTSGMGTMMPEPHLEPYWIDVQSGGDAANAPVITHTKIASPQPQWTEIRFRAKVTDLNSAGQPVRPDRVVISFDSPTMRGEIEMHPAEAAGPDQYEFVVPPGMLMPPGFGYRIMAWDREGNQTADPKLQFDPYWIDVGYGTATGAAPTITHSQVPSPQTQGAEVVVAATVSDRDTADVIDHVDIEVTSPGQPPFWFPMDYQGTAADRRGSYLVHIPPFAVNPPGFEYRIHAGDDKGVMGTKPALNYAPYWVDVVPSGVSGLPPTIEHRAIPFANSGDELRISAVVSPADTSADGSAIAELRVKCFHPTTNRGIEFPMPLLETVKTGGRYEAMIPPDFVSPPGFEYRIIAKDMRSRQAQNPKPQDPPYWVEVRGLSQAPTITHSVVTTSVKGQAVPIVARIQDDIGVTGARIHVFRTDGYHAEFPMVRGVGDEFNAAIPGNLVSPPGFSYFIEAQDTDHMIATSPPNPSSPYVVTTLGAAGGVPPQVTIFALDRGTVQPGTAVEVRATITDPDSTGGLSASLSCKAMNDFSPPIRKPMQPSGTNPSVFVGTLPAEIVAAPGFNYAVEAKDGDANMTLKPAPPNPPYFVEVFSGTGDPPNVMHRPPMQVPENQAVNLLAQVSDEDGIDEVFLQYLPQGSMTQTPVRVDFTDYGNGSYGCVLPAEVMRRPGIEYRILARDSRGDVGLSPAPPEFSHFLEVGFSGGPGARPEVFHEPVAEVRTGNRIRVDAEVRDADSQDLRATLYYEDRRGSFEEKELPMAPVEDEVTGLLVYRADIPAGDVLPPGLVYWIEAGDPEGNKTECPMPPAPPFYVRVVSAQGGVPPRVVHDPVLTAPASTDLVISADLDDADGIASARLAYLPAAEVSDDTTHVEPYWVPMTTVSAKGGTYSGTIPAEHVAAPGVFYVINARDTSGDETLYPEYPAEPLFVSVNSTLTVREPQDHAVTSQATLVVLGSDTGGAATVNGDAVTEWTGTDFRYTVALREGQNVIVVGASDASEVRRRVTRTSQAPADAVVLVKPGSGKELSSSKVLFSWEALPQAARYLFQLSTGETFAVLAESLMVADHVVTLNGLADGRWFWRVKAYDAAGNAFQRWSETRELVVNTRILPPPQIDVAALQSSANQPEVSITGTSRPGSYVTVYVHGASLSQSVLNTDLTVRTPAPTGADGIFRIPGVRLFQGKNEMVACAKDSVAVSAMSDKVVVHHDNTVPRAPFLETVSGATLEGLAEPGVTVEVYLDAVDTPQAEMDLNGTTTSDATTGRFSYRLEAGDGTYALLLRSRDPSGNTGAKSLLQISPFVLDTVAPAIPMITAPADGAVLRTLTVDVSGTAAAGDAKRIAVWVNGREYGRADVSDEGAFQASSIVLAAGSNVIQAKARDRYNNWSALGDSVRVNLDTGGIAIADLSPADQPSTLYRDESLISDSTPTIRATVTGAEQVRVRVDAGSWNPVDVPVEFEIPPLPDGAHRYEIEAATSSDTAAAAIPFVLDTAAPALTNLVISEGDSLTNDPVPVVRFNVSDTGVGVDRRGVALQFNGSAVRDQQNIVVEETGAVSYMPAAPLADGVYSISAAASDKAGNDGNTLTGSLRIDTKPPLLVIAVTPPFADDFSILALRGKVFIFLFADERLAATPVFTYETYDGQTGSFVLEGPSHDERSGLWYYTHLYDPSTFGGLTMQAVGEDVAGNTGVAMETFVLQDVAPEDGGTVRHEDGVVVIIPVGATGDTVAVSITPEQEEVENQKFAFMKGIRSDVLSGAGVKAVCNSDLPGQLGKIYSFGPEGVQFTNPVEVDLSYAAYSSSTRTSKLGLYAFDADLCSWTFVSNDVNADSKKVTGSVTHFSRFALAVDESGPTVTLVTPTSESIVQATVPVEITFSDDVSGIDLASLGFKVDGTAIDPGAAAITDSSFSYSIAFADLGVEHTASFSISDNQGNVSTKSLSFVTTPGLTIGVVQNPIITSELDIYVVSSAELLESSLEVQINGTPVPMTLTDAANQVYRGDYQIPSGGTLVIAATAEDLLGNPLSREKTLGVKYLLPSQPGWAASPGGDLVVQFEEGTVENDFYLLVIPLDQAPANLRKVPRMDGLAPPADATTGIGTAYELSPASMKINRPVRLEFTYSEEALGRQPADNLSIFHWDGAVWRAVDTDVNRTARKLTARVQRLGTYQVRLDPDIGALRGPSCFALHPNYPNPFNPATVIMFDVPVRTKVSLSVFNVRGQLVKTLVSEELPPGTHYARWEGTNDGGRPVASGVYFYRMEAEDYQKTQKMILLK